MAIAKTVELATYTNLKSKLMPPEKCFAFADLLWSKFLCAAVMQVRHMETDITVGCHNAG